MGATILGETIGRYKIIEELGRGGLAVVYRAMDTMLERSVALKMILPEQQQSEKYLRRFSREAKALAQLSHPSIVKILDYGEFNNTPYLVMEFIPGGTLSKRMGAPLPPTEAAALLAPIARALYHAHQHKVIHRDVKPANILINETGQPMLSDFGIVKLTETDESQSLTGTGVMVGTPAYMAPEQIQGRPVDGRSDVYALGVVLFELVTGRKPYIANTPIEVTLKHLNEPVPRARQIIRDLPPDVEAVLLKAMAKKPEDRYQDMALFADVLERMAAGQKNLTKAAPRTDRRTQPITTAHRAEATRAEASRGDKTGPRSGLNRAAEPTDLENAGGGGQDLATGPGLTAPKAKKGLFIGIGAGVLVLALAAGAIFGLPALNKKATPTPVSVVQGKETEKPTDTGAAKPPQAAATATTKPAEPTNTTEPKPSDTPEKAAAVTEAAATSAPTADSAALATGTKITAVNMANLVETRRLEKTSVIQMGWTPDGKWIVDAGAKAIFIIDPKTMKTSGQISLGNLVPKTMVLTSDSQNAVTLIGNQVTFWSLADKKKVAGREFTFEGGANSLDISQDMKTIALGMLDNKVQLVDASNGSTIRKLRSNYGGWSVAFSPDGKLVAAGTSQGALMWETATGTWLPIATGQSSLIKSMTFSHNGKLLAGGSDGMVYLWDAVTGDEVAVLKATGLGVVNSLAFAPDDTYLVTGSDDNTVRLWNVAEKKETAQLKNHVSPVFSVITSPGGDLIASGANEGVIRLWGLP